MTSAKRVKDRRSGGISIGWQLTEILRKAIEWRRQLDGGEDRSKADIARQRPASRTDLAEVTEERRKIAGDPASGAARSTSLRDQEAP